MEESILKDLHQLVMDFGSAPLLEEMPRKRLQDKLINGPTAAHTIEEVHTPLNLSYMTFTTGSSAFQNMVGVTHTEIESRIAASTEVFRRVGVKSGDAVLVTYPPLVNVFCGEAFKRYGLQVHFLPRSSRDAFLSSLYRVQPQMVVGESTFLNASLLDAEKMGVVADLPKGMAFLAAGTPLDTELVETAERMLAGHVHDLYGAQEFGWLIMDGVELRKDISMVPAQTDGNQPLYEVVVGGLPTGDSFPVSESGHICNPDGKWITYRRKRSYPEREVVILETTVSSKETVDRLARTILRIKSRIVKVHPEVKVGAEKTKIALVSNAFFDTYHPEYILEDPTKTTYFDEMLAAQIEYQQNSKADPTWIKRT